MSVKTKLTVIILSLVAIPLLFVSVITFTNYKNSLTTSRLSQLRNLTRFKAESIEAYFKTIQHTLEMSQEFYNIKKHLPVLVRSYKDTPDREAVLARELLDDQLSSMRKVLDLSDVMLTDTNGRIIYTGNPGHYRQDLTMPFAGVMSQFLKKGSKGVYFSDIFINSMKGGIPEMLASVPVVDLNEAPAGALVFEINMAQLYRLIQDTTGLGTTGEMLLGKKSGNEIVYLNPLRHDSTAALKRRVRIGDTVGVPIQKAVSGETGTGISVDYRGKTVVASWMPIPSMGWGMVAKIDSREEFAIVDRLQRLVIMILAIIFIVAGVITYSVAQSISVPIQKLSKGAEIVGGGNLDYKVGMNLNDEIGRLSRSFDKMTHDLKETLASRDELNREIEERKAVEREREISIEFLQLVNGSRGLDDLMKSAASFFREKSGFEAVGIRLKKGDDYPYFETRGFPGDFVLTETSLCSRDDAGEPLHTTEGYPIMECMCGNVIQGRFDPSKSFFTKRGSFWSNCTTELLATSTEADRQSRTRNRCNGEGYESVGLFALRIGGEALGLLQLNDKKKGMFTPSSLALWERLSDHLAAAVSKFIAEEALRESEERFRVIAEASPVQISVSRMEDGVILFANPEYERAFGFAKEEIIGHKGPDLYCDPGDRATLIENLKEKRSVSNFEVKVKKLDGTPFWVSASINQIRFSGVPALLGSSIDITNRKQAEEDLRLRTEELKATNDELTFFNRAMVNREERMIELKKQVNDLCGRMGAPPAYDVDFREEQS